MICTACRSLAGSLGVVVALACAAPVEAQESKSSTLAKELSALLDAAKLDSVAAKDPTDPDQFVAALYFPGLQLLVVSAKYAAPVLLNEKLGKQAYKEIYIDLNSAAVPKSRTFVEDLQANGLQSRRAENQPFDAVEDSGARVAFDGDWKKQKLTEDDYLKAFSSADDRYNKMLGLLISQLKGKS
jgi:hypothetical protein